MKANNRKQNILTAVLVLLLTVAWAGFAAQPVAAADEQAEADWRFDDIVDVAFVQQYAKAPLPEGVMIIDSRPKRAKYDKGHIPMAVSIPDTYFDKMTAKLPADKETLLIFYCGGLKCKLSHKSARKAQALGYTNVKVFAEGFPGWMKQPGNYAAVSADWVKDQIDAQTDMLLVDSRPRRAKYDKGHIPGAVSIPDTYFDKNTDQLPADKNQLVVFYCGGLECKLSHKSAAKAIEMGYTNVKVFAEGYPGWKAAVAQEDQPAAAEATAAAAETSGTALATGKDEGTIDPQAFKDIMAHDPQSIYLVDVRDADEFATGSLESAVNIPVDKLEDQLGKLPTDKPIVFVCGTGARSGESYYMVQDLKPEIKEVYYLDAEMTIEKDGSFKLKEPA